MRSRRRAVSLVLAVLMIVVSAPVNGYAAAPLFTPKTSDQKAKALTKEETKSLRHITQEERELAAARMDLAQRVAELTAPDAESLIAPLALAPTPGGVPDYFGSPNWAFSPPLRKFVDTLPGLGADNANNLEQYIPVAVPDTVTYPGSDYYEIELREYKEQMHSDLPDGTTLRGYVQVNNGTGTDGLNNVAPDPNPHHLGPFIMARKDRPVRVKFINKLTPNGDFFIPIDTTVMGAGMGPLMHETGDKPMNYSPNRATLHLHGGITPWISDGTPHQWITPDGENTAYPEGVSVKNVPDMPDPGPGAMTFFYTNQQSARLMFYHDHTMGITRLNVYAGESAGYLIEDEVEDQLKQDGLIPGDADTIPLIIEDKTFVDTETVRVTDPTWNWGTGPDVMGVKTPVHGDLWYPHVYSPAQNPADPSGMNAFGRWHFGPWFWPPTQGIEFPPVPNPYYDPVNAPWENETIPDSPNPSMAGEAFMDTPIVNGTAFPTVELDPKSYRFRVLNGASDRFWNLQMYEADTSTVSADNRTLTEVKMVPAAQNPAFPETWPTDGRDGGVPDPTTAGPDWIQIGTESGFLPKPAIVSQQPVTWNMDPTTFNFGNVDLHSLLLGPAERADVVVDFSAYRGKTLILYNDAPAAFPARDPRLDYYTGAPDLTDTGGHSGPQVGYGPNTRTIMQIKIRDVAPAPQFDLAALNAAFATTSTKDGVFKTAQPPVVVPDARYNEAYNGNFDADPYARIFDKQLSFTTVDGNNITVPFEAKAIQDEMGEAFDNRGRMMGKLGLQLPMPTTRQTFVLQNFADPVTENVTALMEPLSPILADGVQIWKITHNGVDTHPIHFHLFDIQLINRVGWDNGVRPPDDNELGWKDTVRVNPLEDTVVALRPIMPKIPFGVPESVRLLDPTMPEGSMMGFTSTDPYTGEPLVPPTMNEMTNFDWEYMWHCHILSHEEMEMMRPVSLSVQETKPDASVLSLEVVGAAADLTWTDPTDPVSPLTWGNPKNEIGFRVERAQLDAQGTPGTFSAIATTTANATTYTDASLPAAGAFRYRVVAFNAAGETLSNAMDTMVAPNAPTALTATPVSPTQIRLDFTDNADNETGFIVERSSDGQATWSVAAMPGPNAGTGPVTVTNAVTAPGSYAYRVKAMNGAVASAWSNVATATILPAGKSVRISGADRYEVAVKTAQTAFPGWTGVKNVIIASGAEAAQADALSASGLAGAYNAPLLLVTPTAIPTVTRNALNAMPAGVNVHIVGGTNSVSSTVYNTFLAMANVGNVSRTAGADRYAVAANVAYKMKSVLGPSMSNTAIIANGADPSRFYDALSASPVAAQKDFPILLVGAETVPAATRSALTNIGLSNVYIVGGPETVKEVVRTSLGIPAANRIYGANRYATAVAVANKAKSMNWLSFQTVGIGATIPDSLTGGSAMGQMNGVMLLTASTSLPAETRTFLTANKSQFQNVYVLGGTTSISTAVQSAIDAAVQ